MFGLLVVILFVFISRYQTLPFGQFVPSLYDVAVERLCVPMRWW